MCVFNRLTFGFVFNRSRDSVTNTIIDYFRIDELPNQEFRIEYLPNQDPWKQYAVEELYGINAQPIGTATGQRIDCRGCIKGVVNFSRLLD